MFRKNIALVIRNRNGLILTGERRDIPGARQLPQGGAEPGESLEDTLYRELFEETGFLSDDVHVTGISSPVCYCFPEPVAEKMGFSGQDQIFILLELDKDTKSPLDNCELHNFRWERPEEVIKNIVWFKKECYTTALSQFFGEITT